MRPLTNGELSTWRRCHRKWWLAYERGLKRVVDDEDPLSPRNVGTWVHLALMHREKAQQGVVGEAQAFRAMLEDETAPEVARIMTEGYDEWLAEEGVDQGVTWVDHERVVEATYRGILLSGKVDRRGVDADGRWFVDDYKTVGALDQFESWKGMQTQPKHYMAIERLNDGRSSEWAGRFRYTLLRRVKRTIRAKPPFYATSEVYHTDVELQQYLRMICRVVEEMRQEREELTECPSHAPYPSPTRDCRWDCDFFGVCPMIDSDRRGAEVVLQLGYKVTDPLAHHKEEGQ